MARSSAKHFFIAIAAGLAVAIAMLGLLAVLNRDIGFATCTAMSGAGWTIPLIGGLVIGAVSLLLLDSTDSERESTSLRSSPCASCGKPIISDWRLCPHCGEMLTCETDLPVVSASARRADA